MDVFASRNACFGVCCWGGMGKRRILDLDVEEEPIWDLKLLKGHLKILKARIALPVLNFKTLVLNGIHFNIQQ